MITQESQNVKIITVFLLIWIALMIYIDRSVLLDFANKGLGKVLGISIQKITPTIQPLPTIFSTPTPTDEPTPIKFPVIQYAQPNYQQPTSSTRDNNVPSYQNYGWYEHNGVSMQYVDGNWYSTPQQGISVPTQQQEQTTDKINCNVTANIPNDQPIYALLTPDQCANEQQYAVALWNKDMGQQQQTAQIPVPQYQSAPLPKFNNIPPPPTFSAPPAPYVPPPIQVPTLPVFPEPRKTCYTVIGTGRSDPVTICN